MTVQRGDVVLARVPHTAGTRGKKRPAVVIQANGYNATLRHLVAAEVTSNPRWVSDPGASAGGWRIRRGRLDRFLYRGAVG
jgi:mRNA-degrading endonuclease toxin of MazEF toxin-antitoxin module